MIKYKIYYDRIIVLSFLIGMEYYFWLFVKPITLINLFLVFYIAICCFILLFKSSLIELNSAKLGSEMK